MSSIITFLSNPINAFLTLVVISMFAFSLRTWRSDPKNKINIFFALGGVSASFWLIGVLGYRNATSPLLIALFARLAYVAPTGIAFFTYFFSYYFPYKTFRLKRWEIYILFASTFFILLVVLLPNVFLAGSVLPENRFKPEVSLFWHLVFAVYYFSLMGRLFGNFVKKYKQSTGIWRIRIRQVIVALVVAALGSPIFALFIPIFYDHTLEWVSGFFAFFLVCYIWYHVFWKPWRIPKPV